MVVWTWNRRWQPRACPRCTFRLSNPCRSALGATTRQGQQSRLGGPLTSTMTCTTWTSHVDRNTPTSTGVPDDWLRHGCLGNWTQNEDPIQLHRVQNELLTYLFRNVDQKSTYSLHWMPAISLSTQWSRIKSVNEWANNIWIHVKRCEGPAAVIPSPVTCEWSQLHL